jgi:small-conductance mechanosensitive channel
LLEAKVKWIAPRAVFSDRDLQEQMIEIDKYEEDLHTDLRLAESDLQYAESEWSQVRHELDSSITKNPVLITQVEAKQLVRQLHQIRVAQLNLRLQRRGGNREVWQRRFQVIRQSAETEELIGWRDEAQKRLDQLEREKRLGQMKIDEVREDLVTLDKEQQASDDEAVRGWLDRQRDTLTQLTQVHDANIFSIEASRRLTEKLISEIDGDVKQWTLADWFASAGHYVAKVWNMELTTVDDHPLTIGKVLVGVILLFCGFILARMLSRTLGHRLQHGHFHLNESGASALQSLSFYVFLVCFTLTALKFVNVPLTMFTFLGGAIAIGVGFGSQNILNNFISGLILLAERPVRVGDLIQLDGIHGTVEHIGTRSTRVRTSSNMEIIVPNSSFLENNVLNLTLGDNKVRTHVSVGIAYGSPTRDAARLLKHAADEHGLVLSNPEPFVWFTDFADNSLNFELHFWVEVRNTSERKRVESDLRFKIDHLFREAGVVIAFPQRDVHLEATRPITVQVLPPDVAEGLQVTKEAA